MAVADHRCSMPELPEVETTLRGIRPHLEGSTVTAIVIREGRLRWPVPGGLPRLLTGRTVRSVRRRAKFLIADFDHGAVLVHLGMSGSLRVVPATAALTAHDHVDWVLDGGRVLRYRDPRRFGCMLWTRLNPLQHPLLRELGPEPLAEGFDGDYLHVRSRGRRQAVKTFLMDGHVVVGVGNIYASEALYMSGIHPLRAAGRVSLERYRRLAADVRSVLGAAIEAGGTTLRDFTRVTGEPGYFAQDLRVYDRLGRPCGRCGQGIRRLVVGQRATYYCPSCQH
jgi:formamidopyrimidine-DNA glycosylase